jgi:hypothetical protein
MSDLEEPTPDVQSLISVLILQMQRVYDENIGPVPYNLNENTDE